MASRVVFVLNGPNLGRLGVREPDVYGNATYDDLVSACQAAGDDLELKVDVRQTDDEATLIGWLHEAAEVADAVVVNPAAFTHYSYAVRDAAAMLQIPIVEVHLSNVNEREEWRRHSVLEGVVATRFVGHGAEGYRMALDYLKEHEH